MLTRDDILAEPSLKSLTKTADLLVDLMPLRRKLADALEKHTTGGLHRDRLSAAGLTADDAANAGRLEWRAKVEPDVDSNTRWPDVRKQIVQAAFANRGIGTRVMVWRAAEALLRDDMAVRSGRAAWGQHQAAGTVAALRVYDLDGINDGWLQVPTLHIDATVDMSLLRVRVPHAELVAGIDAAAPFMRVVQYTGKAFGKGALHNERSLDRVWIWSVARASRHGGDWLVVLSKDAETAIASSRVVPSFIRLAHFGALRGLDAYKDVAGIIVIGRLMPPPADVERVAGALSGREVQQRVEGWYPAEVVHLRASDGTAATVEAERHPDALAETVRAAIGETELVQAVGRVRGVNRTAVNPVDVVLLGNVPLPGLPLDNVRPWPAPSVDEEILARNGVLLESAADAATVAGLTRRQVKDRRQRLDAFSYKNSLYANASNLDAAICQRAGTGCHRQRVAYDARRIPDIRSWLEDRLGTLTHFELVDGCYGAQLSADFITATEQVAVVDCVVDAPAY